LLENFHSLFLVMFQEDVRVVIEQLWLVHTSYRVETKNQKSGLHIGELRPGADLAAHETRVGQVSRIRTHMGMQAAYSKYDLRN
jgi:hypothetical protein